MPKITEIRKTGLLASTVLRDRAIVLLNRFVRLVSIKAKSVNCVTLSVVTKDLGHCFRNQYNLNP